MILKQNNIKPILYSIFINVIWLISAHVKLVDFTLSAKFWALILNNFIIGVLNYFFIINKKNKIYLILNLYLILSSVIFSFTLSIQTLTIIIAVFNILINLKPSFFDHYYGLIPYSIIYSIIPIITVNYMINGYITIEVLYNSFTIFSLYLIFFIQKFHISYYNKLNIASFAILITIFLTFKFSIFNLVLLIFIFGYYLYQMINQELPVYLSIFIFLVISLLICI